MATNTGGKTMYQPMTGQKCHCKPGQHRDNCPDCEGTGMRIDFAAIRAHNPTTGQKTIVEFEVCDHGIEHEQYFQGCGISCTQFEDIATGMGDNPAEAIDDALEQLACNGWDCEGMEKRILAGTRKRKLPTKPRVTSRQSEDCHYYLSIRVKS
jgi:hypothetical protein